MKQRVEHVDIAKGISIALVAMFHSKMNVYFESFIEPMALFRVPLFFFLSGIFFSYNVALKEFLVKKSEALLKPYVSVLLVVFLISLSLGDDAIFWQLKGIFYGNGPTIKWVALWFLPHLFLVYLFVYLLFYCFRIDQQRTIVKYGLLALFILVGGETITAFWNKEIDFFGKTVDIPGLPFSADLVLITSAYFIAGFLLKKKMINFKPSMYLLFLSALTLLLIIFYTDAHTDLNSRVYEPTVFATIAAVAGIYFVVSAAWYIEKIRAFKYIPLKLGQASLFILIFHSVIGREVYAYLSDGMVEKERLIAASVVAYIFSISVPILIKYYASRSQLLSLAFFPLRSNKILQKSNSS